MPSLMIAKAICNVAKVEMKDFLVARVDLVSLLTLNLTYYAECNAGSLYCRKCMCMYHW